MIMAGGKDWERRMTQRKREDERIRAVPEGIHMGAQMAFKCAVCGQIFYQPGWAQHCLMEKRKHGNDIFIRLRELRNPKKVKPANRKPKYTDPELGQWLGCV